MTYYRQTQLSPMSANEMREKNYAKYDKYGYRKSDGKKNEINAIIAYFE